MKIETIQELIQELKEIEEQYGNINCYNVEFYIEKGEDKYFLTI